jgi:hypothetical protein
MHTLVKIRWRRAIKGVAHIGQDDLENTYDAFMDCAYNITP